MVLQGVVKGGRQVGAAHTEQVEPHAEYRPRVLCPVAFHQEESPDNDRHRDAYAVRQAVDRFFASAVEETVPFSFVSGTHRFICGIKAGGIYKQRNKWYVFFSGTDFTDFTDYTDFTGFTDFTDYTDFADYTNYTEFAETEKIK